MICEEEITTTTTTTSTSTSTTTTTVCSIEGSMICEEKINN
jgi:hypothetical protein